MTDPTDPSVDPARPHASDPLGTDDQTTPVESDAANEASSGVIDDPDEPINPDEGTVAATLAARESLRPGAPRRPYKGPHSILILLLIMVCVGVVGVYAFTWAMRIAAKSDQADLQMLEERDVMSKWQERYKTAKFGKGSEILPPLIVYSPLSKSEMNRMQELKKAYGTQFAPDERQQALIRQVQELESIMNPATTRSTSGPATQP